MRNKLSIKINNKKELTKEEIFLLREKFIKEYCAKKNWNPRNLSVSQMLEITLQEEYKNPNLLL